MTLDVGDIVFLCSDGISDNFDPAVAKFVPRFKAAELSIARSNSLTSKSAPSTSVEDKPYPYRRQKSEGSLDTRRNLRADEKTKADSASSDVTYFDFDRSGSRNVNESIVHDLRSLVTTTTIINNDFLDVPGEDRGEGFCSRTESNSLDERNNSTTSTSSSNKSNNGVEGCRGCTDELCCGIPLTPRERHQGALEQMREVMILLFILSLRLRPCYWLV